MREIIIAFATALVVGLAGFAWHEAETAADKLFWARYAAGATVQHDLLQQLGK